MGTLSDLPIINTNNDAVDCKYRAVIQGYYKDPYIEQFVSASNKRSSQRKAPEISRGYYARSASVASLVEQFIDSHPNAQIISLGAGFDTLFWRLKSHNFLQDGDSISTPSSIFKYIEIDLSANVSKKIAKIRNNQQLWLPGNVVFKGDALFSTQFSMISHDLRQTNKDSLRRILTEDSGLDLSRPTLCIAECVLVYMSTAESDSLINWFACTFNHLTFLNYEQCNMNDRFGNIMIDNLSDRGCHLLGVDACKSLDTQKSRFGSNGLCHTIAWTLTEIYKHILSRVEIERIERIEFLDEKEILTQLLDHYCIVIASHQPIEWIIQDKHWIPRTL